MKVFLSPLTIYTYKDNLRVRLNTEEVDKFREGLKFAGDFERSIIFSDYTYEELRNIASSLTSIERDRYMDLLATLKNSRFIKVDLTDYISSYNTIYNVLFDLLEAHIGSENIKLSVNVSCGHKFGSLALYLSLMQVIHSKEFYRYLSSRERDKLVINVYHAEKGIIEPLPIIHFDSEMKRDWEEYLFLLKTKQNFEKFKESIPDSSDKVIMYFKKHRYIDMDNDTLRLTKKGETLVKLLECLENQ